jgi:hypothetical protein
MKEGRGVDEMKGEKRMNEMKKGREKGGAKDGRKEKRVT